jgi:hypothetical protein
MFESITATVIFALAAASIIALPGFAPEVPAGEAPVLASQETPAVGPAVGTCSSEVWPDFPTWCLQRPSSAAKIVEARHVSARR